MESLYVTHGDVVVFIDADLEQFDPQFAVGLLGPLLADPSVQFVKAFYDRPSRPVGPSSRRWRPGDRADGPPAAQPALAAPGRASSSPSPGVRRSSHATRARAVHVGYGVEIAMLVDVFELAGLSAMAQVDLGSRRHRNSSDAALGQMAAQVYLALLADRAPRPGHDDRGRIVRADPVRPGRAVVRPTTTDVGVIERPPMADVAEYRSRAMGIPR